MTTTVIIILIAAFLATGYMLLKAREESARLSEQMRIITKDRQQLQDESKAVFRDIASQLMQEQGKMMKDADEQRLSELLIPFKDNIETLKLTIDTYKTQQAQYAASLKQQIEDLCDVNRTIGKEAQELTHALKGNSKMQGDWGELVLKQILDISGFVEGVSYETQATHEADGTTFKNDRGERLRPDVIFNMPDQKRLIIDSKVSLTAFSHYTAAQNNEQRTEALSRHIVSMRKHIDELSSKAYQRWIKNSADFTIMFVPNEPAYLLAMSNDNSLWEYAFKRQVVIVSPTHLISVVKLIDRLWMRERQTKNALKIANEAGKMYDKLVGFVADLQNVNKTLGQAQKACDAAMNKLQDGNGNLIARATCIKQLRAKTSKQLPEEHGNE